MTPEQKAKKALKWIIESNVLDDVFSDYISRLSKNDEEYAAIWRAVEDLLK